MCVCVCYGCACVFAVYVYFVCECLLSALRVLCILRVCADCVLFEITHTHRSTNIMYDKRVVRGNTYARIIQVWCIDTNTHTHTNTHMHTYIHTYVHTNTHTHTPISLLTLFVFSVLSFNNTQREPFTPQIQSRRPQRKRVCLCCLCFICLYECVCVCVCA